MMNYISFHYQSWESFLPLLALAGGPVSTKCAKISHNRTFLSEAWLLSFCIS